MKTNEALSLWFDQQTQLHKPITRQLLAEKAQLFKAHFDKDADKEFTASNGFIDKFCARKGLKSCKPHGEQLSADSKAAESFIASLHLYVQNEKLILNQLFNMDECGLMWKAFPGQTLIGPNEQTASKHKDRITLGLCANDSGTLTLPLIVIHKAAKPHCFDRKLDMNKLPVHYRKQSNAWMDQDIFCEWFHRKFVPAVEDYLETNGIKKKALLLLDNCPAHPLELVSKSGLIKTKFLPPNTTSLIQPMDKSPIAVLKKAYR